MGIFREKIGDMSAYMCRFLYCVNVLVIYVIVFTVLCTVRTVSVSFVLCFVPLYCVFILFLLCFVPIVLSMRYWTSING